MGSALFVFDPDTANAEFWQNIENFQVGTAGIAEQNFHALGLQALGQERGAAQGTGTLVLGDIGEVATGNGRSVGIGDVFSVHDLDPVHQGHCHHQPDGGDDNGQCGNRPVGAAVGFSTDGAYGGDNIAIVGQ